jgi:autotransporter-associated beta strand protein
VDSGATLVIGDGVGTVGGSVAGNILDNGAVRFARADNVAYAGLITGNGTVTKLAAGTLTLSRANTYSGGTTIATAGGTLLANNGSGSATGSGNVTVGPDATLGGIGAVAGSVFVSGRLSPGASIESLGTGSLNFNPSSVFKYELNTSDPAGDLVNATGGLSISTSGAGVHLTLYELGTFSPLPIGTKFTLISYDGTWDGGSFFGLPQLGTVTYGFHVFQIRYQDTSPGLNFASETALNTTGRFVTLTVLDLVPEPGSITMALIGCCAMTIVRSRKAKR